MLGAKKVYHQGNAVFGTGMFQNLMENSRPTYEPWKTSVPSPGSLQQWPHATKIDPMTMTTQKSSAGSSCGDDDWNRFAPTWQVNRPGSRGRPPAWSGVAWPDGRSQRIFR
eukprot:Skav212935  [mRNA]  locus=scaffold374:414746:418355:- [translate_table: standard]